MISIERKLTIAPVPALALYVPGHAMALHVPKHMTCIHKPGTHRGVPLSDFVHRFKSFTTTQYRTGVIELNWPPLPGRLWQRNYYEHIIRDEEELNRIRNYIAGNPLQWDNDENNPVNE